MVPLFSPTIVVAFSRNGAGRSISFVHTKLMRKSASVVPHYLHQTFSSSTKQTAHHNQNNNRLYSTTTCKYEPSLLFDRGVMAFEPQFVTAKAFSSNTSSLSVAVEESKVQKVKKPKKTKAAPPPPPELKSFTALSFYRFHSLSPEEVKHIVEEGPKVLTAYHPDIKGTLLVAGEGINGQFCIPTDIVPHFVSLLQILNNRLFDGLELNCGQIFPQTHIGMTDFPFKKLRFKAKKQILTDRLSEQDEQLATSEGLDWTDAGPELTPEQWHHELDLLQKGLPVADSQDPTGLPPLLFDCRNLYESEIGTFANAVPLETDIFSESWKDLEIKLQNEPKQRRILTFCTGGIRCVKTNAFLKQKLGFENIGRLEKGIIAYEEWIKRQQKEQKETLVGEDRRSVLNSDSGNSSDDKKEVKSLFVGTNFIFDRRRLGSTTDTNATATNSDDSKIIEESTSSGYKSAEHCNAV